MKIWQSVRVWKPKVKIHRTFVYRNRLRNRLTWLVREIFRLASVRHICFTRFYRDASCKPIKQQNSVTPYFREPFVEPFANHVHAWYARTRIANLLASRSTLFAMDIHTYTYLYAWLRADKIKPIFVPFAKPTETKETHHSLAKQSTSFDY